MSLQLSPAPNTRVRTEIGTLSKMRQSPPPLLLLSPPSLLVLFFHEAGVPSLSVGTYNESLFTLTHREPGACLCVSWCSVSQPARDPPPLGSIFAHTRRFRRPPLSMDAFKKCVLKMHLAKQTWSKNERLTTFPKHWNWPGVNNSEYQRSSEPPWKLEQEVWGSREESLQDRKVGFTEKALRLRCGKVWVTRFKRQMFLL